MKKKTYHKQREIIDGIYKLVWNSGHYYIGKSIDIYGRYYSHISSIKRGKDLTSSIKEAISFNKENPIPKLEIVYTNIKGNLGYNEGVIIEVEKENPMCINRNGIKFTDKINKKIKGANENVCRKVLITDLTGYEFRHIINKYGSIDEALKRLLLIEPI